jgi:hypothetical protein
MAEDYVYSSAVDYAAEKGFLDVIVVKGLSQKQASRQERKIFCAQIKCFLCGSFKLCVKSFF